MKFSLSAQEATEVVLDDHEDFSYIKSTFITSHGRWSIRKEAVYQQLSTGKHYRFRWEEPATEQQECDRWDSDPYFPVEVEPKHKTVVVYEEV